MLHILTHKRLLKFLHIFVSLGTASGGDPRGREVFSPRDWGGSSWEPSGDYSTLIPTWPQPKQGTLLPRPSFLSCTIQDVGIGTFRDLAMVLETAPILTALDIFVDRRVSALPVVNEAGTYTQDGDSGWGGTGGSRGLCDISSRPRMESGLQVSACFEPWISYLASLSQTSISCSEKGLKEPWL